MIYTIKHAEWQWQIAQDPSSKKYNLMYKKPMGWTRCSTEFDSAEQASDAVVNGKTGLADWDSLKHATPVPTLGSWLIDPSGSHGGVVMQTPVTT